MFKRCLDRKGRLQKANLLLFVAIGLTLFISGSASAGPIMISGSWNEFHFTDVGEPATGCTPADPGGFACIPSSGGNSIFAGKPPYTFTAPIGGALLTITDAFTRGDAFSVFDFGILVGSTPLVSIGGSCGNNPFPCFADPLVSHGVFNLSMGAHSITFSALDSPFGEGSAYFRVDAADPVPEPATMLLLATGLAGISAAVKRKRKAYSFLRRG